MIGKIIMIVMNAAPGRTNANSVSFFLKKYPLLYPIFPLRFTKRALRPYSLMISATSAAACFRASSTDLAPDSTSWYAN